MQIAPPPVNHAGMRSEDIATAIAWYPAVLSCYLIDGRARFTDADRHNRRSAPLERE